MKRYPHWKEKGETIFVHDMVLYRDNPKVCIKKLLKLINEFSKVAGYKIKTQKPIIFLHTSNESFKNEVKKKKFHLQKHQKE